MEACESLLVDPIAKLWRKIKESEWSRLTHRPDSRWKKEDESWWRDVVVGANVGLCIGHGNDGRHSAGCVKQSDL